MKNKLSIIISTIFMVIIVFTCLNNTIAQCSNNYEPNNSISTATNTFQILYKTPITQTINSQIRYDDQDWYKIGLDLTGTLTINLTNLPANFDVELYGSNGLNTWLAGSNNIGTNAEQIIYTHKVPASTTWYIKVYGNNLAFNNTSCYALSISWAPCPINYIMPDLLSPGSSTSPGATINTLTPTFDWSSVTDATDYGIFVRDLSTNQLILADNCGSKISQYTIPSGLLSFGKSYRWNVQANINCGNCVSEYSQVLFFNTSSGSNCSSPSDQASDIYFSNVQTDRIALNWKNGNGDKRIVKINTSNNFNVPVVGTNPQANSTYAGFGEQVIYNGSGNTNTVTVTNLTQGTNYHFRVYEGNCTSSSSVYNVNTDNLNPNSTTTDGPCLPPSIVNQPQGGNWCIGQNANINTSASGSNLLYQWEKKSGNSYNIVSGEKSNIFSTNISGIYRCVINNSCGTIQTSEVTIQFSACTGPIAQFSTLKSILVAGESTTLLDQSINAAGADRIWKVEREQINGTTTPYLSSTALNPIFQFPFPGCYKVTLTVSDGVQSNTLSNFCFILIKPDLNVPINLYTVIDKNYPSGYGGDPVNTATGDFCFSMKDLSIFSMGKEIPIERRYVSSNTDIGAFGKGWFFMYDTHLVLSNPYQWELHHGDGHITYHIPYAGGETRSLYAGLLDSLYYTGNSGIYSYIYQEHTGVKWHFLSNGKLDKIVDLNGNTIQCVYTSSKLAGIIAPGGRRIWININSNKRIIKLFDATGRTVDYFYSGSLDVQLDSVRIQGSTTSFKYNAIGLTEINDPNGNRIVKIVYHPTTKKVIRQYDVFDHATDFDYNSTLRLTTITYATGTQKKHKHDASFRLILSENELAFKKLFSYTNDNQVNSLTDERNYTTKYFYDNKKNLSKITDPKNYQDSIAYTLKNKPNYIKDALGNETTIQYDILGNPIVVTLPNSGTIYTYYDNRGLDTLIVDPKQNETRKTYNTYGDLISVTTPSTTTQYAYDSVGRLISIKNGKGYIDNISYNYFDQITRIADPMGYFTSFEYDKNGNNITYTDKENNRTYKQYDSKDRLVKIIEPRNHVTTIEYDLLDRLVKYRDANGNTKLYTYDDIGRMKIVTDSILGILVTYNYDEANNVISMIDQYGNINKFNYDERNLPITFINPLNISTTVEYNGKRKVIKATDETGKSTMFNYDAMGLQKKVIDASGNSASTFYDLNGNMDSLIDAKGNLRRWTYDAANRVKTYNDGFGNHTYSYDSTGNLIEYKDRAFNTLFYTYDPNNMLLNIESQNGPERSFVYSPNGWMKSASNTNGITLFSYNELGWLTVKKGLFQDSLLYSYDSVGNISTLTYPGDKTVHYEYNSDNKSTKVIDWNNQEYLLHRNANGTLDSISYPHKYKSKFFRDKASQIISWQNCASGISPPFHENFVTRERNGFILKDTGIKALDPIVDLISSTGIYDVDDRQNTYGAQSYEHDGNGNRTKAFSLRDSSSYTYTPEGYLNLYTHNGSQASMVYNALNQRVQKNSKSQIQYSLDNALTAQPLVLTERNVNNQTFTSNVYTPEGILLARDSSGNLRYFHHDIYGNTIALSNISGTITDKYGYSSFGDFYSHLGPSTQPYTFLGKYGIQKEDSVLYYIWARYYDASTGRFFSKDPFPINTSSTQGTNRYPYGLNSPASFVDVNGMFVSNTSYELTPFQKFAVSKSGDITIQILEGLVAVGRLSSYAFGILTGPQSYIAVAEYNALLYGIAGDYENAGAILIGLPGISVNIAPTRSAIEGVQYTKSNLKLGQQMHKAYKLGAEGKEFRLPSGLRIDYLDIKNSTLYELKPFNPRAMAAGQKQLNIYMRELETLPEFKGINWKTVLDVY